MPLRLLPALLLLPALAAAQPDAVDPAVLARAEALRDRALVDDTAWRVVEGLTTEVGARMPGSPAEVRAEDWVARRFAALGFDRVLRQPVSSPVWRRGHERAEVVGEFAQPLLITALGYSVGSNGPLEAEVVGFDSIEDLEAAPAGSLEGKLAYIGRRMERHRDGRGYGPVVRARSEGASTAASKGAVALLIRSVGTDSDRLPHTGVMGYDDAHARIPAAALSVPDADQVERLLARGKPLRIRLDIDAATIEQHVSYNIIGEVTGSERPEEFVVIGGHLDSWDLGTGAIDDGAGVAITMAAGALIAGMDQRPSRTVRVVAFANEEQGLWGAKAYAAHNAAALPRHVLGAESDFGAGRIYALRSSFGDAPPPAIAAAARLLEPLGIEWIPSGGGPGPDIWPMARAGVPWAQLAQDGTDYFDWHHTANDTLDKIDPEALPQQVAAYAVLAWLAAELGTGERD